MERSIVRIVTATQTLEGAGFPVRRPIPVPGLHQVDPFLLLDHLGPVTWGPGEAVGAPDHPHRGFETVTYLLAGRMQHRDSAGNEAVLGPGDAQWMTAGAGVVHSEMPYGELLEHGGTLHGFQIWVNLPARDKMMAPRYQDIPAGQIPEAVSGDGKVRVKVIAGEALGVSAPIETRTPITYLHYRIAPGGRALHRRPASENVVVYVFAGAMRVGPQQTPVAEGQMAVFGRGDSVSLLASGREPAEALLLAGEPIGEPVARHGPFVMNTQEEIRQAYRDYHSGAMGTVMVRQPGEAS